MMTSRWPIFLHPYYVLHALTLVSYLVLHHIALQSATDASRAKLKKWELQAALSLAIILLIKYVRRTAREAYLAETVLYSKVMVALLAFMLDWRLLAWYLVVFTMLFLLCIQPASEDQGNIRQLTPLQLENLLLGQNTTWLVEFGAVWSPRCIQLRQLTADLSVRYSKSGVQFARIDLGRFPIAAAKYGIAFGVALRQLPTLILFKGGTEACRLPEPNSDGTFSGQSLSEAYIVQKFGLDGLQLHAISRRLDFSESYQKLKQPET